MDRQIYNENIACLLESHKSRSPSLSSSMKAESSESHRDPNHTQAWLIGGGIASLSAAVYLVSEAQVPGPNIHLLDLHSGPGGGMTPREDPQRGCFIPFECHPHFHGSSLTKLLSLVPSKTNLQGTLLDDIRRFETIERPQPQTAALSRALKLGSSGPEIVETKSLSIGAKNRMNLVTIMLERETTLGSKSIEDIMDEDFFRTTFWMLWATECVLSPYRRISSPA